MDDIFVAAPPINPGWEYNSDINKTIYNPNSINVNENPDTRTARVFKDVANTLENDIKFTVDTPSNSDNGRMPVLDLTMWVSHKTIEYSFYKKPVSSKFTVLKRSAVTMRTKLDTIFQESLRRLYNVSPRLPWSEKATHLSKFVKTLAMSGYNEEERYNTVKGAIVRYNEMVAKVESGEIESLNRSREQIIETKISRMIWPNTWYLKGEIISTLNCSVTPGSKLKTMLSKSINNQTEDKGRVLVIEDGGRPITSGLKVGDPSRKSMSCIYGKQNCIVSPSHRCGQQGVVYKIQCKSCNAVIELERVTKNVAESRKPSYVGVTRTTVHNRMESHLVSQKYKHNHSPMWRHDLDAHEGTHQEYVCTIIGNERKIVRLYMREAIEIEKLNFGQKLNDRDERGRGGIVRITAQRQTS